ncbi:MAG: hypothetical protein JETCAE03_35430 [Ignavibacteriaceae bacterium]|nr:MAG: hypothetical protein JETCAE03_35430 [Ignavibacteriaceae bacterium]
MSNFIKALIAVGILLVIGFFIGKSCSKEEVTIDHARENELLGQIKDLATVNKSLTVQRDSLLKIPAKIKTQIVYREREIDEAIAKDSTNALVQYRQALTENGDLPESGEYLSFREIGLGAKNMARLPHLRLTIKTYEEIVKKDNEIISNLNFQIEANEDLREMQRLAIINCEKQLEKEKAWYNSNYLWLGLGVIGTTAIIFLTGAMK